MALPSLKLRHFRSALNQHAVVVALIMGILMNGWLAWQIVEQWSDRPLPPDRVTAKQLRVNESQRLELNSRLDAYRQPKAALPLPTGLF